jgi:acyl dehydratase
VVFRHTGVNQRDEIVFTCERRVLVRRRAAG